MTVPEGVPAKPGDPVLIVQPGQFFGATVGVPVDDPEDAEDEDLDEPRWGWIRG